MCGLQVNHRGLGTRDGHPPVFAHLYSHYDVDRLVGTEQKRTQMNLRRRIKRKCIDGHSCEKEASFSSSSCFSYHLPILRRRKRIRNSTARPGVAATAEALAASPCLVWTAHGLYARNHLQPQHQHDGQPQSGGFNIEVSKGALSNPSSAAQVSSNGFQATHNTWMSTSWTLDWTAPAWQRLCSG